MTSLLQTVFYFYILEKRHSSSHRSLEKVEPFTNPFSGKQNDSAIFSRPKKSTDAHP